MFSLHAGFALCFVLSFAFGARESSESEIAHWEAPEYLKTKYPYYLSGNDYEDSPVFILPIGKWDFLAAVTGGRKTAAELHKWITQMLLRCSSFGSEAMDVGSPGAVVIVDNDIGIAQLGKAGVMQHLVRQLSKFYHLAQRHGIKKIYIVNGTNETSITLDTLSAFEAVLARHFLFVFIADNLVQFAYKFGHMIQKEAAHRIEIHGINPEEWKPVLLKAIPAEELPSWLGGSMREEDMNVFG